VRLPAEDFEAIERIAAQANVLVGALIRGWVLAGLAGLAGHVAARRDRPSGRGSPAAPAPGRGQRCRLTLMQHTERAAVG